MHPFDRQLTELERAQHGLVALAQLAGDWKAGMIRHRVRARRARVAPRVFANAVVPSSYEQRVMAAVLSAGPDAVASHDTAARLWDLPLPGPATLELTTAITRRPLVPGARMHRSSGLAPEDLSRVRGIPATKPALTIYSLSVRYSINVLGRMVDDAVRRRIMTLDDLADVITRVHPSTGRSRKAMVSVLLQRLPGVNERESDLEDFVLAALMRFRLPIPTAQHPVQFRGRSRRIDLCYVDDWLALEAKGFTWYRQRSKFDRDALRGNDLLLAGYKVLSFTSAFTDRQIAVDVAAALGLPEPADLRTRTYAEWMRTR